MGRSVPTYRMMLEHIISEWNSFRRALRAEDKRIFDELMNKARSHASASGYQVSLDPVETVFLSMLLELSREVMNLKKEIEELRDDKRMVV